MIEIVRKRVSAYLNKEIMFRYNGSRNQVEEFSGKITACYKFVFIIDTGDIVKSFSYSDVLIGALDIDI